MESTPQNVFRLADEFFMKQSPIHQAAERIAKELTKLGIDFAVGGGFAMIMHGYRRFTEDVDLIMTAEGLARFKAEWLGRGWVERVKGSRGLRDAVTNGRVDVLLEGDFPGDGKPKPVCFPNPAEASEFNDDYSMPVLKLEALIELKLASGMSASHRMKDLADVQELIKALKLPREFGGQLNPWVQETFYGIWDAAQGGGDEDY